MEAIPYFGLNSPRGIGQALKDARKGLGLAQADVAGAAGISREALARIETGRNAPRIDSLVAVLHALGHELVFWPRSMDVAHAVEAELSNV